MGRRIITTENLEEDAKIENHLRPQLLIGKKTAEKLIIELKDKLDLKEMLEPRSAAAAEIPSDGRNGDIQTEAVQALVALGYGNAESLKAVRQVTEYTSVEDVLKEALKKML